MARPSPRPIFLSVATRSHTYTHTHACKTASLDHSCQCIQGDLNNFIHLPSITAAYFQQVMVSARGATWAWLGFLLVVWCLPLEGVRSASIQQQQQQQQQQPPLSLLEDLSSNNLPPQDFTQDDFQPLLTRRPETVPIALLSYDGSEGSPYMYQVQQGLAGAGVPATGLQVADVSDLENSDWMAMDPRNLVSQYLDSQDEATGSDSELSSMTPVRRIRNSPNSSNSFLSSSNFDNSNSNSKAKRAWPHGFSRRRTSGLSLSIDASMKVLREALYLEMARKKQRQQMQRARHNQALLTTIGKRDVQHQLQEDDDAIGHDHLQAHRN